MTNILQRSKFAAAALFIFATMLQVAIAPLVSPAKAAAFSGAGEGTSEYPYRIADCTQLQSINSAPSAYYMLQNDIDCSGTSTWNGGLGFAPITSFSGNFDGRYHTISGLTINRPSSDNVAFINGLNGGTLRYVNFTNVNIHGGNNYVAAVVASASAALMSNINVSGTVQGGSVVSGLAATISAGTIVTKSSFTGTVTNTNSWGAGLVTFVTNSSISNSYFNGTENGSNSSAGIAASVSVTDGSTASISDNYVVGTINDLNYRAAIINFMYVAPGSQLVVAGNFAVANGQNGGSPSSLPMFSRIDSGTVISSNNIYDRTQSAIDYCASLTCSAVNTDGTDGSHFKNNTTVAPFNNWNFGAVWQVTANYPTFTLEVLGSLADPTAPDPVTNVQCTPNSSELAVTWTNPTNNGHSPLLDTQVEYKKQGDNSWTSAGASPYGNITIGALTNGDQYYARVIATNAFGDATPVECGPIVIGVPPGSPENFSVQNLGMSNQTGQVGMTWEAPADTGTSPITGYKVSYSVAGENDWGSPIDVGNMNDAVLNGVASGRFDFKLWAVNANGEGTPSYVYNKFIGDQAYNITTCQELQNIQNDPEGDYTLANDIDCSDTVNWDEGQGFMPIDSFSGQLDGQNHTVSGLFISRDNYGIGLFDEIDNGVVADLNLTDINYAGYGDVGGVTGYANGAGIYNVSVQGSIYSQSGAGGIIGYTEIDYSSPITINDSDTNINFWGYDSYPSNVGGLVGYYYGYSESVLNINNATTHTNVLTDNSGSNIGGLIGYTEIYGYSTINISGVNSTPNISVGESAGGLIGYLYAESDYNEVNIDNAVVNGDINTYSDAGGLIGQIETYALQLTISNTKTSGSANAYGYAAGGFIGEQYGGDGSSGTYIEKSYSDMDVNVTDDYDAGGLVGYNDIYLGVNDSYYNGDIQSSSYAGGIIGQNEGSTTLSRVYAVGSISGGSYVGGLIGYNSAPLTVESSFAAMSLDSGDPSTTGGITGYDEYYGSYYEVVIDESAVGTDNCFGNMSNIELCATVNGLGDQNDYFFNNSTNAPIGSWDFENTWITHDDTYPTLRAFIATPQTPVNLTSTRETSSRVFLDWEQPSEGPEAVGFQVQYRPTYSESDWTDYTHPDTATATSVTVNGLHSNTSYDFRIRAIGDTANSDWSETYTVSTKEQIYEITSCDQLQDIAGDLEGNYSLKNDINCTDTPNWNGGHGFWPIGYANGDYMFTGTLAGDNYTISNLNVIRGTDSDGQGGLFSHLQNSEVYDLYINNAAIAVPRSAGMLAGSAFNSAITNVHVEGVVRTTLSGEQCTGGLIGCMFGDNSEINRLYNVSSAGSVYGFIDTGGLTGILGYADVRHSYSTANVSSSGSYVGGITGYLIASALSDVYATGNVETSNTSNYVGGLVGQAWSSYIGLGYSSGTVSGGYHVGGIAGALGSYSVIDQAFTVSPIGFQDWDLAGAVVGDIGESSWMLNVWYDYYRSILGQCTGNAGLVEGCNYVNADNFDPAYFANNNTVEPIAQWDFDGTWVLNDQGDQLPKLAGVPEFPIGAGIHAQTTTNSITVSWEGISSHGSPITSYELLWNEEGSDNWHEVDVNVDDLSATITGLKPNTKYNFQWRAFNAYGSSRRLGFYTFTKSLDTPASTPALVVVTSKSAPKPSSQSDAGPQTANGEDINLDDFSEYANGQGKLLNLKVGQVVHFTITKNGVKEHHTATVKEIGDGYVILTIASTPFDVKIFAGQTMPINIDGQHVIDIKLQNVNGDTAGILFSKPAPQVLPLAAIFQVNKSLSGRIGLLLILIAMTMILIGVRSEYKQRHWQ